MTVQPARELVTYYELESCISLTAYILDCAITYSHVKGHQDDNLNITLSWEVQLNVICNAKAKDYLATMSKPATAVTLLPGSGALLLINATSITSHPRRALHKVATAQDVCKYYQDR
jgi:hypothetical protein